MEKLNQNGIPRCRARPRGANDGSNSIESSLCVFREPPKSISGSEMSPFLSGTHRRAAIEEPIIVTPRSFVTYVSLLNLTLVEVAAAIIQMLLFLHELMLEFNLSLNPRFYEIETNSLLSECVGAPLSQSPFYSWIFRKT